MTVLEGVLNLISLGKYEEGKKMANYDNMYHLGLIFVLQDNTHIMVEKNERIDMDIIGMDKIKSYGELYPIYLYKRITFKEILDNAQKAMGGRYFQYDPFLGNNCQVYAKSLLEYSGLLSPEADKFIFQPLEEIVKKIPKSTPIIARGITQLGAFFANIGSKITGRGDDGYALHAIIVKKPISVDELKKIQKEFVGNKTYIRETKQSFRIRNIPKQKFEKDSFRSQKIKGKNITLVYGKLKDSEVREVGGVVSRDLSSSMKKSADKKIKDTYDFISSLPKIPSGKKPIIAKTKEERARLRKDWEEENRPEMERLLYMTDAQRKEYRDEKKKEYDEYMNRGDVKEQVAKEQREYGEKAKKMIEKAKKFSSLKKLIDDLKSKKESIKAAAEKYLDKKYQKQVIDDYNSDMEKVQSYDFYNIKNTELKDQLDKQYMKMYENMLNRPKTYGHLPSNKNYEYGRYRDDPRYIRYIYENYGKPEPDFLIDMFDTVSGFIGDIPVIGDIFTPVNDIVQGEIRKVDLPKKGEELPDVDFERGFTELENLQQNVEKAQNVGEEIGKLEGEQTQLEQQQKEVVGSGKKYDFRKLLKSLKISQKKYLDIMNLMDGSRDLIEISIRLNRSIIEIAQDVKKLKKFDLIKEKR
jgi:hypothetical protein